MCGGDQRGRFRWVFAQSMHKKWRLAFVLTTTAVSAWCALMALSLCAVSCSTSCPPVSSGFATMGCWHPLAKGSSWQRREPRCRCLRSTRRPWSRPMPSWRGWQRWMCCCARVAGTAGCKSGRCSRVLGGCQRQPTRWCPSAGDPRDRRAVQPIGSSLQAASSAPEAVLRLAAIRPARLGWRNGGR